MGLPGGGSVLSVVVLRSQLFGLQLFGLQLFRLFGCWVLVVRLWLSSCGYYVVLCGVGAGWGGGVREVMSEGHKRK